MKTHVGCIGAGCPLCVKLRAPGYERVAAQLQHGAAIAAPCVHFGAATGEQLAGCAGCGDKSPGSPVHHCRLHGACSPRVSGYPGIRCCAQCPDRQPADRVQFVVTADGIGDHMAALTVTTAYKRAHPASELTLIVKHAQWVRLFEGYDALAPSPVVWAAPIVPEITHRDGGTHFVEAVARHRPRALPVLRPLPAEAHAWAAPYRGAVVLAPVTLQDGHNRDWLHSHWLELERQLLAAGYSVVVIAGGRDGPHVSGFRSPALLGEPAERVAALMRGAACVVANESGMAHLAGVLQVPAVVLAAQFKGATIHGFYPRSRVIQGPLACSGCRWTGPQWREACHHLCASLQSIPPETVLAAVKKLAPLPEPVTVSVRVPALRATTYEGDYYDEHTAAGLDYLAHGEWQEQYGHWLADAFDWRGKAVLDIGCACGSILRGFHRAGVHGHGLDLSAHMVGLGRAKWPELADVLHVGDAAELGRFADGAFDGLHSAQVFEHLDPARVPATLRELRRVIRGGGLLFCALDTTELFARQGRTMDTEDPTHICVRPRAWWQEQFAAAGWRDVTGAWDARLREAPGSFLARYDWDYLVLVG
jgi:SAM-dependent methyltransferase